MRFSAILTVLAGLCSISNAVSDVSVASREASSLEERSPVHPRDFGRASLLKRVDKAELGMGEAGDADKSIAVVGVNGCSGVYIWAGGKIYGAHVEPGEETDVLEDLQGYVEDDKNVGAITDVTIQVPDNAPDVPVIKGKLTWTNKTPETFTYPYKGSTADEFELTATVDEPGQCSYDNNNTS